MLLGVLSDTHGQVSRAHRAIALLRQHGAEALAHCGDLGDLPEGDAILTSLAAEGVPVWLVWGNNDLPGRDRPGPALFHGLGVPIPPEHGALQLTLADRLIEVWHGHEDGFASRARDLELGPEDAPALLLSGHTHVPHQRRVGRTLWVNPGALHRARLPQCCVIDLTTLAVETIPVIP